MLVDDFLATIKEANLRGAWLNDAVIFRVDEPERSFLERQQYKLYDGPDLSVASSMDAPSFPPYENFVIHLADGFQWCVVRPLITSETTMKNGRIIFCQWVSKRKFYPVTVLTQNDVFELFVAGFIDNDGSFRSSMSFDSAYYHNCVASLGLLGRFLNLISCKNIRARNIYHRAAIQKRREKRGQPPLFSYKILELCGHFSCGHGTPVKERAWTNRVHLCRGHVALYGPEYGRGLLFGKYAGRFWIPPHVRGDKKQGVVLKDYDVTERSRRSRNGPGEAVL